MNSELTKDCTLFVHSLFNSELYFKNGVYSYDILYPRNYWWMLEYQNSVISTVFYYKKGVPLHSYETKLYTENLRTVKFIPKQHSNHYNHYKSFVSMQHSIPMGIRVSRLHFWTAFRVHSYAAFYSENTEWELKETKQSRINSYVVSHSENLISIYSYFPICFSESSWIG